ncbi:hypothetical protein AZ14_3806, partial [Bordetella bronchiseptica 980]
MRRPGAAMASGPACRGPVPIKAACKRAVSHIGISPFNSFPRSPLAREQPLIPRLLLILMLSAPLSASATLHRVQAVAPTSPPTALRETLQHGVTTGAAGRRICGG